MEIIAGTMIYTLLQGIAFNIVLPLWAMILSFQGLM